MNDISPQNEPIINLNYFDKEIDLDRYIVAVKDQATLANTKAFKKYGAELIRIPLQTCDKFPYESDDYNIGNAMFKMTVHRVCIKWALVKWNPNKIHLQWLSRIYE